MILPVKFLWEQLNGPQVTGIENAIFQYYRETFDSKLDYLNTMNVDNANDSHLTFLGILANFIRPVVTVPDKDYFYFSNGPDHDSVNGVSSREDRTIGGKFVGMSKAGAASSPLNTEHYRLLLKTYIEGEGELGGLSLLDDILYALSKQDQPERVPTYKLDFVTEKNTPVGRAAGDVYIDVGTLDDWNNPMQVFAILDGLAKSVYWPVPQLFVSIDTAVTVPGVTASIPSGTYTGAQTIELRCANPSAIIYYTLDNTPPSTESPIYTSPITIPAGRTVTLKARAYAEGYNKSITSEYSYRTVVPVDDIDVSVSLAPGNYPPPQTVELSAPYDDAVIYYTLDGTTPGSESTVYTEPIELTESTIIKTMVYVPGSGYSNVKSFEYNIIAVPLVTSNVPDGTYDGVQTVALSCNMEGHTPVIYYTTDGSMPTDKSKIYTGPIDIKYTQLLTAIGYVEGIGYSSSPSTFEYNINWEITANLPSGSYVFPRDRDLLPSSLSVFSEYLYRYILSCNCPNSYLIYTTDGTVPDPVNKWPSSSPQSYINMYYTWKTVKVRAYIYEPVDGIYTYIPITDVVEFNYDLKNVVVTSDKNNGDYNADMTVTLISQAGAPIYYTLDGSDPTTESTLYTDPIEFKILDLDLGQVNTITLKAITVYEDMTSEVFTRTYNMKNIPDKPVALPAPPTNWGNPATWEGSATKYLNSFVAKGLYDPDEVNTMLLTFTSDAFDNENIVFRYKVFGSSSSFTTKTVTTRDPIYKKGDIIKYPVFNASYNKVFLAAFLVGGTSPIAQWEYLYNTWNSDGKYPEVVHTTVSGDWYFKVSVPSSMNATLKAKCTHVWAQRIDRDKYTGIYTAGEPALYPVNDGYALVPAPYGSDIAQHNSRIAYYYEGIGPMRRYTYNHYSYERVNENSWDIVEDYTVKQE